MVSLVSRAFNIIRNQPSKNRATNGGLDPFDLSVNEKTVQLADVIIIAHGSRNRQIGCC